MTRWIAAPLVAATMLFGSGFLESLELMTERSLDLAEASRKAPRDTREAAAEVESLPVLAELTTQQADAFAALADALEISSRRVVEFNGRLEDQAAGLEELQTSLEGLTAPTACISDTLEILLAASDRTPTAIDEVASILASLTGTQKKAIRHLKSINRKLTALGVAATASDVEPPPPPEPAPPVDPGGFEPGAKRC